MRLFVGIPLPEAVRAEVAAVVKRLRPGAESLRWSGPESWHITLQFLGNTGEKECQCVVARLGELQSAPVPIQLSGLGAFDRAGVVYAGVELTPELQALQKLVTAATGKCGFAPEERAYHPHITLARSKGHGRGQRLPDLRGWREKPPEFSAFTASQFLLYESFTERAGARYEVRGRFALEP